MAHRAEFQNLSEHRWNLFWALQRLGLGAIVSPEQRSEPVSLGGTRYQTVPLNGPPVSRNTCAVGSLRLLFATGTIYLEQNGSRSCFSLERPSTGISRYLSRLRRRHIGSASHETLRKHIATTWACRFGPRCAQVTADAYIRIITESLRPSRNPGPWLRRNFRCGPAPIFRRSGSPHNHCRPQPTTLFPEKMIVRIGTLCLSLEKSGIRRFVRQTVTHYYSQFLQAPGTPPRPQLPRRLG